MLGGGGAAGARCVSAAERAGRASTVAQLCVLLLVRAVPAFELAILRAIFHSKGPKA
jgi:hypothetical protein